MAGERAIGGQALAERDRQPRGAPTSSIATARCSRPTTRRPRCSPIRAEVLDPQAAATQLAGVLTGVDPRELLARLDASRGASSGSSATSREAERAGGGPPRACRASAFAPRCHRIYPQRALTAHLVGYVGVENQGLAGIETQLRGPPDRRRRAPGAAGPDPRPRRPGGRCAASSRSASRGFAAKGGSRRSCSTSRPASCWPMVSLPDFDPNRYRQAPRRRAASTATRRHLRARLAVQAVHGRDGARCRRGRHRPAASTPAQPLQFGRYPDQRLPRQAALAERARGDRVLVQHRRRARWPMALGTEGQLDYLRALRACSSGIRSACPRSAQPQQPAPWRPINTVTAAYGHGLAVSPLQMADAVAAASAPAPRPRAHLVAEARAAGGSAAAGLGRDRGQAALADVAHRHRGHRQRLAKVPGYLIGGKTGSADKAGRGGYRGGGCWPRSSPPSRSTSRATSCWSRSTSPRATPSTYG